MSMRKRTSPAAARRRPAALFLLVDVLAAALLVFGNYFFLYIAPMQGLGGASMSLPQVQNNLQPSAHQQVTEITGSAPEQTQPLSLREKFAEHFTDTVVSTGTSYSSPDLSVEVTQHTFGRRSDAVTYYVADIYMADLRSFQTEFAGGKYDANGQREHLDTMSRRVGAILAMNGDSYCFNRSHCNGLLVRNGTVYRNNPTTQDICVLYQDGTMATYGPDQFDPEAALEQGILQTWIFGPRLLDDRGKALTSFDTWDYIKKIHPPHRAGVL